MANPCPACTSQDCENCKIKPKNKCSHKCQIFSRVCGYFAPTKNFNLGKKEEFRDRKVFKIKSPS